MPDDNDVMDSPIAPDGTFTESFKDSQIPSEVKELVAKKGFKNIADIAKAYMHNESEFSKIHGGRDYILLPKDDNPDEWSHVWNKLGRPETFEGYDFKTDIKELEPIIDDFRKFAHPLGLTKKQFNDIVKFEIDRAVAQTEAWQQQQEQDRAAREKAVREKFKGDLDNKVLLAQKVAEKFGKKEYFEKYGLNADPDMLEFLVNVGSVMSEDSLPQGSPKQAVSPDKELEEILKSDAFRDRLHPDHKKVHNRFLELHGLKTVGKQTVKSFVRG